MLISVKTFTTTTPAISSRHQQQFTSHAEVQFFSAPKNKNKESHNLMDNIIIQLINQNDKNL